MSQSLNIIKHKADELPNNIEAEQSVIGSVLLSNEIFDDLSLIISSANFFISLYLWYEFDNSSPEFQFVENRIWIKVKQYPTNILYKVMGGSRPRG